MNHYDFGNYLTEKRKSIGYSQFQFGKLLGVSGKAVSKWETGASVPKLETLTKIASLTGTDLGDLVSMREVGDFEITKIRRSKKAAFWNREENRLAEIYGDDVPLSILDRYYTEKELTAFTDSPLILDALGKVREIAEVTVNGRAYPAIWKPPYQVDITDALGGRGTPTGRLTLRSR